MSKYVDLGVLDGTPAWGVVLVSQLMGRIHRFLPASSGVTHLDGIHRLCRDNTVVVYVQFCSSPAGGLPLLFLITNTKKGEGLRRLLHVSFSP